MIGDNPIADVEGANKFNMVTLQKVHAGVESFTSGDMSPDIKFHDYSEIRKLWASLK